MKNKKIRIIFLILSIALYIYTLYEIVNICIFGFGPDIPTPMEVQPRRYGMEALRTWINVFFGFGTFGYGKITIPIYTIAFLYIVIYIQKSIKNKIQK